MKKRISFDIPLELHHEIQLMAMKHNIPMGRWILRAIIKELKLERKCD